MTGPRWDALAARIAEAMPRRLRRRLGIGVSEHDVWWESSEIGTPSLDAIRAAAQRRDIPWVPWPIDQVGQLGHGRHQRRISDIRTQNTSALAQDLAGHKHWSKRLLREHGVPVPRGGLVVSPHQLGPVVREVGFPLVVKPAGGSKGRAVSVGVDAWPGLVRAFVAAKRISRHVLVERYHPGRDFRLLVVDGRLVAAAERTPARIVGDGRSSVRERIAELNADPRRDPAVNLMSRVVVDGETRRLLRSQGLRPGSVLQEGRVAVLKRTANLSTGGSSRDTTDLVHPENVRIAERAARLIGLDIIGLDVVSPDIAVPLEENAGVIVEANAGPGLRMHLRPSDGAPRDVGEPIVRSLFPPGARSRVPIVAVTGTNGKTTTTRLVAHLLRDEHESVGWCTTEGIYLDGRRIAKYDASGQRSAYRLLREPTLEAAAFEVARGGLLHAGLGFDACDVGILTNVEEDHLALQGIETIEQLAALKGRVIEAVRPNGLAVLNAEDALSAGLASRTRARIAFFSLDPDHPRIVAHVADGGLAAVRDGDEIHVFEGSERHRLGRVAELPITFGGRAPFMVANVLAAILAGRGLGMARERIWSALARFEVSPETLPGRMNLIPCGRFHALVDYAHNAAGMRALAAYLDAWDGPRVGAISIPGDRRDEDFTAFAREAVAAFDRIVVWEPDDPRGRPPGETSGLLAEEIRSADPERTVRVVGEEETAFRDVLEDAPDGALVALLAEHVDAALEIVEPFRSTEVAASRSGSNDA